MKIAFIGDSFCFDTGPDTWPRLVADHLNGEIVSKGKSGGNEWETLSTFKNIVDTKLAVDLFIFCHTDPYRLPNRHNEPFSAIGCEKNKNINEIWNAGNLYYEHLMSFEYHEFMYILMLDECQRILEKLNTPYLHLFSFDPDVSGYKTFKWNKHLPNSETRCLSKISYQANPTHRSTGYLPNHMNHAGNKLVSKMVLGKLKTLWNITQ